mmetsp:Transcript_392/g.1136  ORF Transcript_392/g.1136 Transcript_392/m.1136 type:complete len:286 (-) Transcript_392:678-1535(-)
MQMPTCEQHASGHSMLGSGSRDVDCTPCFFCWSPRWGARAGRKKQSQKLCCALPPCVQSGESRCMQRHRRSCCRQMEVLRPTLREPALRTLRMATRAEHSCGRSSRCSVEALARPCSARCWHRPGELCVPAGAVSYGGSWRHWPGAPRQRRAGLLSCWSWRRRPCCLHPSAGPYRRGAPRNCTWRWRWPDERPAFRQASRQPRTPKLQMHSFPWPYLEPWAGSGSRVQEVPMEAIGVAVARPQIQRLLWSLSRRFRPKAFAHLDHGSTPCLTKPAMRMSSSLPHP